MRRTMLAVLNSVLLIAAAAIFLKVVFHNSPEAFLSRLASNTPYRFVANFSEHVVHFNGCYPKKIVMVVRHGTRYPDKKTIDGINKLLPEIRDHLIRRYFQFYDISLDSNVIKSFMEWRSVFNRDEEKFLVDEGKLEMFEIAGRMKQRFPLIFQKDLENSPQSYRFRFTDTQRTEESAKYFAKGLFGEESLKLVNFSSPIKHDPVLRFYKVCDKWKQQIKKNLKAFREYNLFEQSAEMSKLIKMISYNLKLPLTLDNVTLFYKACAFETAINRHQMSPWCSLLSPELIKALEYAEDLKYYWIDGYGHKLTYSQACALMQNIIQKLKYRNSERALNYAHRSADKMFFQGPYDFKICDKLVNEDSNENGIFYFTHSGTILKLLAHLGLYRDAYGPLKHSDFGRNDERLWKVSKIDTFATNLAFVLYNCKTTGDSHDDRRKLLIMHQERMIDLHDGESFKSDNDNNDSLNFLYDMDRFPNRYPTECNFQEMCRV